jgi:hypothetical protein
MHLESGPAEVVPKIRNRRVILTCCSAYNLGYSSTGGYFEFFVFFTLIALLIPSLFAVALSADAEITAAFQKAPKIVKIVLEKHTKDPLAGAQL